MTRASILDELMRQAADLLPNGRFLKDVRAELENCDTVVLAEIYKLNALPGMLATVFKDFVTGVAKVPRRFP